MSHRPGYVVIISLAWRLLAQIRVVRGVRAANITFSSVSLQGRSPPREGPFLPPTGCPLIEMISHHPAFHPDIEITLLISAKQGWGEHFILLPQYRYNIDLAASARSPPTPEQSVNRFFFRVLLFVILPFLPSLDRHLGATSHTRITSAIAGEPAANQRPDRHALQHNQHSPHPAIMMSLMNHDPA